VYDGKAVHVLHREGRGYLAGTNEKFSLIQVPLADLSLSAGAGVQAGRESYLFTVEAFEGMLSRLTPDGMICVTSQALVPPRDEFRLLDIAYLALRSRDDRARIPRKEQTPRKHIVLIRNYDAVSVLIANSAVTEKQFYAVIDFCKERSFDVSFMSGLKPEELEKFHAPEDEYYVLCADDILGPGRDSFLDDYMFDVRATTDDRPYFFHFFRFKAVRTLFQELGNLGRGYLEIGYVLLLAALAQSVPVAGVLILLPLAGRARVLRAAAGKMRAFAYFLLIGVGFMFLEMMFLQRLTLYLAHPIYSAAVVIGVFLVFAGIGSRLSQRWKLPPQAVIRRAGLTAAGLTILYVLALKYVLAVTHGWPLGGRVALTVVSLAPLALAMGHMFPTALRLLGRQTPALVPWCWAVNGFASVVATVGATLLAMEVGFVLLALAGAGAYLLACTLWGSGGEEEDEDGKPRSQLTR